MKATVKQRSHAEGQMSLTWLDCAHLPHVWQWRWACWLFACTQISFFVLLRWHPDGPLTTVHLYHTDWTKDVSNIPNTAAAKISVYEDTTMEEQKVQHSNVRSKLVWRRARDEKIVALILVTHEPKHVLTLAVFNRKPSRCTTSILFIQMA